MRLLKVLFVGLFVVVAVIAGGVVAAVVAAVGLLIFFVRRLLTGSRPLPFSGKTNRYHPKKANDSDVIEVSATEVKS